MIIPFRIIKSLDIVYVMIIQFIIAVIFNIVFDHYFNTNVKKRMDEIDNDNKNKNVSKTYIYIREILNMFLILSILGVASYLGRQFVKVIPSPFDGINGLTHGRLKELNEAGAMTAFIFLTSNYLDSRIQVFRKLFEQI